MHEIGAGGWTFCYGMTCDDMYLLQYFCNIGYTKMDVAKKHVIDCKLLHLSNNDIIIPHHTITKHQPVFLLLLIPCMIVGVQISLLGTGHSFSGF